MNDIGGPGTRNILLLQGCSIKCDGCLSSNMWPVETSFSETNSVEELADLLTLGNIDGITISGGEPFNQIGEILDLVHAISKDVPNIIIYTGYTIKEIIRTYPNEYDLLSRYITALVAGPYKLNNPEFLYYRGSRNQAIWLFNNDLRYSDFIAKDGVAEVLIRQDEIEIIGFPPPIFLQELERLLHHGSL